MFNFVWIENRSFTSIRTNGQKSMLWENCLRPRSPRQNVILRDALAVPNTFAKFNPEIPLLGNTRKTKYLV